MIFIAGNMPMVSEITPLLIITKLEQYDYAGATAIAAVMLVASFVLLLAINALQAWTTGDRQGACDDGRDRRSDASAGDARSRRARSRAALGAPAADRDRAGVPRAVPVLPLAFGVRRGASQKGVGVYVGGARPSPTRSPRSG